MLATSDMPSAAPKAEERAREFRERPAGNDLKDLIPNPRVVLDCGAGAGGFATAAFTIWPNCTVHSFEPAQRFNSILTPLNARHFVHRVALGESDRLGTLNCTVGPESNSLLGSVPGGPMEKSHRPIGTEEVEVCALDSIVAEGIEQVDLLKVDVQGAELLVLQGAKEVIRASRPVIYCAVAFQSLYQDQPLLDTVDEYLEFLGYRRLYLYASPMPDLCGNAIYVPKEYRVPGPPIRLNIGAGDVVIPGFTAIDRKFGTEAFPLEYANDAVEEIRCVHMLEHLSYRDVDLALKEWYRVLKPGGRLRVSVPDVPKVARMLDDETYDPMWRFYLFGGQTDDNDFHRAGFDARVLSKYLTAAGFERVRPWTSENTDLAAAAFSLNLEAYKPAETRPQDEVEVKIRAVCGMPRVGWNDSWQSFIDALKPFGIPIETHQGCFWWQNMQCALSRALRDGIDWVVTLDYDSMILPHHVRRLLDIMSKYPHIDAVAALQMRRGAETPLFSTGKATAEINGEPIRVNTAHFGLTVLRVAKLAAVPKPWLIDEPDADGEFTGNHVDADITFWKKWTAAGNTIYIAPDVRIGHLELLVSEFDENYEPQHYQIGKWWNMHAQKGHCNRTVKGT